MCESAGLRELSRHIAIAYGLWYQGSHSLAQLGASFVPRILHRMHMPCAEGMTALWRTEWHSALEQVNPAVLCRCPIANDGLLTGNKRHRRKEVYGNWS
jgi:hypothetical protein